MGSGSNEFARLRVLPSPSLGYFLRQTQTSPIGFHPICFAAIALAPPALHELAGRAAGRPASPPACPPAASAGRRPPGPGGPPVTPRPPRWHHRKGGWGPEPPANGEPDGRRRQERTGWGWGGPGRRRIGSVAVLPRALAASPPPPLHAQMDPVGVAAAPDARPGPAWQSKVSAGWAGGRGPGPARRPLTARRGAAAAGLAPARWRRTEACRGTGGGGTARPFFRPPKRCQQKTGHGYSANWALGSAAWGREGGRSRAGQGMAWVRCSRQLSPRWRELLLEPDKRAASLQALPVSRGLDLGEFGYRGGRQRVTAWLDSSSPDRRLPGQNCVRASAVWRGCLWRAVLSGLQKWGRKLCVSRYCWVIPREVLHSLRVHL